MAEAVPRLPANLVFEYQGLDDQRPVYVDGAFGQRTPRGALHVVLYSEYWKPSSESSVPARPIPNVQPVEVKGDDVQQTVTLQIQAQDPGPYQAAEGGDVRIVRQVEASLILTKEGLDTLIPWLVAQRGAMEGTE